MTHTIIIETQSENDFELIKGLAQRLGRSTKEVQKEVNGLSEVEKLSAKAQRRTVINRSGNPVVLQYLTGHFIILGISTFSGFISSDAF